LFFIKKAVSETLFILAILSSLSSDNQLSRGITQAGLPNKLSE
jgi:hypothetical protein